MYQQLTYDFGERKLGYHVLIIPVVIGCIGRGVNRLREQIAKLETDENKMKSIWREILKTAFAESESILRKVLSKHYHSSIELRKLASKFW